MPDQNPDISDGNCHALKDLNANDWGSPQTDFVCQEHVVQALRNRKERRQTKVVEGSVAWKEPNESCRIDDRNAGGVIASDNKFVNL